MSVQQLERSLARLKIESEEQYDALWKKYTKEKEQYELEIAHRKKQEENSNKLISELRELTVLLKNPPQHRGASEFTLLAKDLRGAIVAFESDSGSAEANARNWVHCAFEQLFRIITERKTPSYQDIDNIQTIRSHLTDILDD